MEIWNQFGVVIAVLGSLLGIMLWLKKRGGVTATRLRELQVIDRVVVSGQHTLVLLEVRNTRMLVCLSPGGSNVTVLKGDQC
jgi:hypothetical protein